MNAYSRLLPLLIGALSLASVATAQQGERPSAAERRQQVIDRKLERIFREKVRSEVTVAPERKHDSRAPLMRAPSEVAISSAREQEAEIHAVINPADSNNIVISAIRSSNQGLSLPIFYSRDFGETWQVSSFQPRAMGGGDPVFTADAEGTLYYSWIELVPRSASIIDEGILWTRSTDGGATWAPTDTITWGRLNQSGQGAGGEFADKQWMAVDLSSSQYRGTVYTIYFNMVFGGTGGDFSIVVQRKPAGSGQFLTERVPVTTSEFVDMQFASIGVDHRGDVHAFFYGQHQDDEQHRLWHAVSHDGARTFETPRPVGPIRFPERSNDVPEHLPQRLGALPQFAVDGSDASPHKGNLYGVWFSNDVETSGAGSHWESFHVYFARSTDGGASWSAPRRINDDHDVADADHVYPSIDVAPNGAVVLTWYDGRAGSRNSEVHHYTAYSLDGGATFGENIRVTTEASSGNAGVVGNFGIGDYTKCLSTNGYAIPIWVDGRENDGDLNVYAAFVPLRAGGASGVEERRRIAESTQLSVVPNPVATAAQIELTLATSGETRLEIVDVRGRMVAIHDAKHLAAGTHRITVDCSAIAPGHYIVRATGAGADASTALEIVR